MTAFKISIYIVFFKSFLKNSFHSGITTYIRLKFIIAASVTYFSNSLYPPLHLFLNNNLHSRNFVKTRKAEVKTVPTILIKIFILLTSALSIHTNTHTHTHKCTHARTHTFQEGKREKTVQNFETVYNPAVLTLMFILRRSIYNLTNGKKDE